MNSNVRALASSGKKQPSAVATWYRGLSRRERILMTLLAVTAIFSALVFFIVMPCAARINALSGEIETLKNQETSMRTTLSQVETWQKIYDESQAVYIENEKRFCRVMPVEKLDEAITGFMLQSGFALQELKLQPIEPFNLKPYAPEALIPAPLPEINSGGGIETAPGETVPEHENTGVGNSYIWKYTATAQAAGSFGSLYDLLTKIRALDGVAITAFSYDWNRQTGATTAPTSDETIFMVDFEVYVLIDGNPDEDV